VFAHLVTYFDGVGLVLFFWDAYLCSGRLFFLMSMRPCLSDEVECE